MARLSAAAPALIALMLLAGCGGHDQDVVRTSSPVVALALDGNRLA